MADKYNSKIAAYIGKRNGVVAPAGYAVTISSTCTLYSLSKERVDADPAWRAHEDCHKAQIKREGWLPFMVDYLYDNYKYGYNNNEDEIEAEKAEEAKRQELKGKQ